MFIQDVVFAEKTESFCYRVICNGEESCTSQIGEYKKGGAEGSRYRGFCRQPVAIKQTAADMTAIISKDFFMSGNP